MHQVFRNGHIGYVEPIAKVVGNGEYIMKTDILSNQLVSIVMPCPNSERFIRKSVESILNQTHIKLELIIVADRVTDDTLEIVKSFKDSRIVIVENRNVVGIAQALNIGYGLSKGDFIGRMDADDTCSPYRIFTQLTFLFENPHIDIVGTACEYFGDRSGRTYPPINHAEMYSAVAVYNPILHASILFRRNLHDLGLMKYELDKSGDEDYSLWVELFHKNVTFANINAPLYNYRIHDNNAHGPKPQNKMLKKSIVEKLLKDLGYTNAEELAVLLVDFHYDGDLSSRRIISFKKLIAKDNLSHNIFGPFNFYAGRPLWFSHFVLILRPVYRVIRKLKRVMG
jgi:glycosyltransferase involved in cell wall biosynthesis